MKSYAAECHRTVPRDAGPNTRPLIIWPFISEASRMGSAEICSAQNRLRKDKTPASKDLNYYKKMPEGAPKRSSSGITLSYLL